MSSRCWWTSFVVVSVVAVSGAIGFAQSTPSPAVAEVRATVDAARKAIDAYKAAGGAAGAADPPAIEWDTKLWAFRERDPRSDAGTLAAAESVRLLVRAELWDRAHARIAAIPFDDPVWVRLAIPVYDEGIARKDLPYTIETLSRVVASTTNPTIKAAVLVVVGRAHRRAGDFAAATSALDAAKAAAPSSLHAEEAEGILYEIKYLRPGLPAPAVAGKARNGAAIDLAVLRGKAVVLVFWGST